MKELFEGFMKSVVLQILSGVLIGLGLIDLLWYKLPGGLLFAGFTVFSLSLVITSLNITIRKMITDESFYNKMKNNFKL